MMRAIFAVLLATLALTFAAPTYADDAVLAARIEKLAAELETVKAELRELKAQRGTAAASAPMPAPAASAARADAHCNGQAHRSERQRRTGADSPGRHPPRPVRKSRPRPSSATAKSTIRTTRAITSRTQADLARAVIGIGYRFDDKTRFVAEFEWEHAVTSADDQGEAEVEQFYVEHSFTPQLPGARDCSSYRRACSTPLTSRPVFRRHAQFRRDGDHPDDVARRRHRPHGRHRLRPQLGCRPHDRFQSREMGPTSDDGKESPLGSIHQELQLAKAANLSAYGALNWRGYPGLLLGGSIFYGQGGSEATGLPIRQCDGHAGRSTCALDAGTVRLVGALCARATSAIRLPTT